MQTINVGKKTINFNEANHRFTDEQGKKINSVTSFTGIIDKSGDLLGWATRLTRIYLLEKLNRKEQIIESDVIEACKQHSIKKTEAGAVGTLIHDWVEQWIKTKKKTINSDDERVVNGIQAFLKFQEQHKFKWLESEKILYSVKHNYAGVCDAIATDQQGRLVLVDFKSSNGLYNEYAFQAAAYQMAYEEMTGKKIVYRLIIRFGKDDGEFEAVEYHENNKDKAAFLACKTLKDRLSEMEK